MTVPRFNLRFSQGEGALVLAQPTRVGLFTLESLVLDLGQLSYPLSASGGVRAFRDHRTRAVILDGSIPLVAVKRWAQQRGAELVALKKTDGGLRIRVRDGQGEFALRARFFGENARLFVFFDELEPKPPATDQRHPLRRLLPLLTELGFELDQERGLFFVDHGFRSTLAELMLSMGFRLPDDRQLRVWAPAFLQGAIHFRAGDHPGSLWDPLDASLSNSLSVLAEAQAELSSLLALAADSEVSAVSRISERRPAVDPSIVTPGVDSDDDAFSTLVDDNAFDVSIDGQSFTQIARRLARSQRARSRRDGSLDPEAPHDAPSELVDTLESSVSDAVSKQLRDRMGTVGDDPVLEDPIALAQAGVLARDAAQLRAALRMAERMAQRTGDQQTVREVIELALGVVGDGPARASWIAELQNLPDEGDDA